MTRVSKNTVDDIIRLTRKYAKTGDVDFVTARINAAKIFSREVYGAANDHHWLGISDLIGGILSSSGLKPHASNQEIYAVLNGIGFEVNA